PAPNVEATSFVQRRSCLLLLTRSRGTCATTHWEPFISYLLPQPASSDKTLLPARLDCSALPSIQSNMEYQQACGGTTSACHHPVYATHNQGYTHAHHMWTAVPQYHYGYEQHSLASPVGNTFTQAPVVSPINTTSTEPIAVDGRNGFVTMPPGQPLIYRSGVEGDYGQPTSPTVEFNVDELLEYQRRRSSATSEEKEPLTPAQRRRKAQNRAAYVSRSPSLWRDFPLTRRGGHSQRAFRDRKRQRVQDLEAQLSALEVRTNSLESDNERLKHELLLTRDENEVLRSITQPQHPSNTLQPDRRRRTMKAGGTDLHLPLQ
ncbi:hypothetical protein D6C80_00996, partial [Aureobasidium pullulans]